MLVPRGIRLLAGQCRTSPFHVWFLGARPLAVDRTARVWYVQTPPTSMAAAYSTKRNDDPSKQVPSTEAQKSSPMPPSKPPSFDSRLSPPNIKMPSREQVEQYFFTALVYVWDFCAYVFSLSYRLIDTYVLNNPTLQAYWKKLIKRLDDQRDSIKSKK